MYGYMYMHVYIIYAHMDTNKINIHACIHTHIGGSPFTKTKLRGQTSRGIRFQ